MEILGIDVGGTGIKGAPVNTASGELAAERFRLLTPDPATPDAVAGVVAEIVDHFQWKGPVGCGFPAAIRRGEVCTAANISKRWLGVQAARLFEEAAGCPFTVANDADVAGLAEMRFGAGRGREGVVLVLTLGTGIGSALFVDGHLVPNTELGHIEVKGRGAEEWAAESVREAKDLSWKKWSARLNVVLEKLHAYLWPDVIILGGGVSKKHEKFLPRLSVNCELVPAELRNQAGIVGAALAAEDH
jgi:polyphosphate glucokinase